MQTDYEQITKENIEEYGKGIGRIGPMLLAERYSDRTHFVYELLQNAEDAIRWRKAREDAFPKEAMFSLRQDGLVFSHFGLPFRTEHVRAICGIACGTKGRELTDIGKHGIGFKSVYAYTRSPEIHSGDEHFVIKDFVRPRVVRGRPVRAGETLFWLPFDHGGTNSQQAFDEIRGRLSKLGLRTLLFLTNLESIGWEVEGEPGGQYLRQSKTLFGGAHRVTLFGKDDLRGEAFEEWLVFRERIEHEGRKAGFVEVAFCVGRANNADQIVRVDESPLVVFFPTEKETHLGFLVQGPYRTTPSRDNVPKDDAWNRELVSKTAKLVVRAVNVLRTQGLLNAAALNAFAMDRRKYESESQAAMFRPIYDGAVEELKTKPLIPAHGGRHVRGNRARIARSDRLRGLCSPKELGELVGSDQEIGWVTAEITPDRTAPLFEFLSADLGIDSIDADKFVRAISEEFLRRRSDRWIAGFYAFLRDQPAMLKAKWLLQKPIIRLQNGDHVAPFRPDGTTPRAFLPCESATDAPTIRSKICDDKAALEFLKAIGLTQPDPVDDVICNVLPRYKDESATVPVSYAEDIRRIADAYETDSTSRREKLVEHLRKAAWVRAVNPGTGANCLKRPAQVYTPSQKLQALFSGNPQIWFADRDAGELKGKRVQAVLRASGVAEYLCSAACARDLSAEQLSEIRRAAGLERCTWQTSEDGDVVGLAEAIGQISSAAEVMSRERSLALWICLCDAIRERGSRFLYVEYRWGYSNEQRTAQYPTKFVRRLQREPWLPGPDGMFKKPAEIYFEDLPPEFREHAQRDLIGALEFKPPEVKLLADKVGISEELLDVLREVQSQISPQELRKLLGIPAAKATATVSEITATIDGLLGEGRAEPDPMPAGGATADYIGGARTSSGGASTGNGVGSGSNGGGGMRVNFHTYVSVSADGSASGGNGQEHEERMALEKAAIDFVCQSHADSFAEIRRMPVNHEGYDLEAIDASGNVKRLIEVKAMRSGWQERPVTLSHAQLEMARREGPRYWLYVVERAGDPEARVFRIRDPANKIVYYCFDDGWQSLGERGPES